MFKKILYSTLLVFIVLVLINIANTLLPIGVGAVGQLKSDTHHIDGINYDDSSMKLVLTNDRMSFISSRPSSYYSLNKLYSRNMILSLISAFLLSTLLYILQDISALKRMLACAIFGLLIITSVHLSYWNWWGFSNLYSIGVSISSFVSILLSCIMADKLIFMTYNSAK